MRFSLFWEQIMKKLINSLLLVYSFKNFLSMGLLRHQLRDMKLNRGYLILEAMIALTMAVIFTGILAFAQSQASFWHREAQNYLKAVTLAERIFEHLSLHPCAVINEKKEGMDIKVSKKSISEEIPYKQVSVFISWQTREGMDKNITIMGGIIDEA